MTNLKKKRAESGLSQSQLAEKSGTSVRMIQHYEQGAKDINAARVDTVYKLALALDCKISEIIEEVE